jgi:hypothetical protein
VHRAINLTSAEVDPGRPKTDGDASIIAEPTLQIARTASNYFRLSWPTNASDFTPLQNSNFVHASWSVVANAAAVVGTNSEVLVPAANGARFFRLGF